MFPTYKTWKEVPAELVHQCNECASRKHHDTYMDGKWLTYFPNAQGFMPYATHLTEAQTKTLFYLLSQSDLNFKDFTANLYWRFENVYVEEMHQKIAVPVNVAGVWPHCKTYGELFPDGQIRT